MPQTSPSNWMIMFLMSSLILIFNPTPKTSYSKSKKHLNSHNQTTKIMKW